MQTAIRRVSEYQDLSPIEMQQIMRIIMSGHATAAQIAGFLVGLRMKGETVEEITAAVSVMRDLVLPVTIEDAKLVDIVGTGGDGVHTFNVSTASAFVIAAAGAKVAKHGNRSVSSQSGSADVLEAAGVALDLTPLQIQQCIQQIGIGFLFAQRHHAAMRHVSQPRREMGIRTLFNLLGALTNPAHARLQVIGVYEDKLLTPVAEVLSRLGTIHAIIVHSEDGLDEISICAPTHVAELKEGKIKTFVITPEQLGVEKSSLKKIQVADVQQSLALVNEALDNVPGPARDIVALNAGAGIYVAGLADTFTEGVKKAFQVIATGEAKKRLNSLIKLTQELAYN